MNDYDYIQLEKLLDSLRSELGCRFCINISSATHDSYTIAIYNNSDGKIIKQETTWTIANTVQRLKDFTNGQQDKD